MSALDARVKARFEEWQRCRAELQEKSRQLDEAMRKHVEGTGPMPPPELIAAVPELRLRSDALFQAVVEAMYDRMQAGKP